MTVKQVGTVDWLGLEKDTGHVRLTVIDDLDWTNEHEHLHLLQEKLNAYLAFMESGEVFEALAHEVGRQVPHSTPIKVGILAKYEMTLRASEFLAHARSTFAAAGFELIFKLVRAPNPSSDTTRSN